MTSKARGFIKRITGELNRFFEETTIHGFTYLSHNHPLTTKSIWTTLLVVAFSLATFMIGQNLQDATEHPLSTTLDTVSVTQVSNVERNLGNFGNKFCRSHWPGVQKISLLTLI